MCMDKVSYIPKRDEEGMTMVEEALFEFDYNSFISSFVQWR